MGDGAERLGQPADSGSGQLDHDREMRLAVVMTGGVSLAVWMGGVAHELYRLTERSDDNPYQRLQSILRSRVTIDILTGTSAGGINAVALALATRCRIPVRAFGRMRQTWMALGDIEALLEDPADLSVTSLLRGDAYFLPQLTDSFQTLVDGAGDGLTDTASGPLDLVVPTTLLHPNTVTQTDSYGFGITELNYRARFAVGFGEDAVHNRPHDKMKSRQIVELLALAARSSASFPLAFEPSKVDARRKRAARHVDFEGDRELLDGGILDNKPLGHALEVVERRRGRGTVKRTVVYVAPNTAERPPLAASPQASLRDVLVASAFTIPSYESIEADLGRLREYNGQILAQQLRRTQIIKANASRGSNVSNLAIQLVHEHIAMHAEHAAQQLLTRLSAYLAGIGMADLHVSQQSALRHKLSGERRAIMEDRVLTDNGVGTSNLAPRTDGVWPWGTAAVRYMNDVAGSITRRALAIIEPESDDYVAIADAKDTLHDVRRVLFGLEAVDDRFWDQQFAKVAKKLKEFRTGDDSPGDRFMDFAQFARESFGTWPFIDDDDVPERDELNRAISEFDSGSTHQLKGDASDHEAALQLLRQLAVASAEALAGCLVQCDNVAKAYLEGVRTGSTVAGSLRDELEYFRAQGSDPQVFTAAPAKDVYKWLVDLYIVQTALGIETVTEHSAELLTINSDTTTGRGRAGRRLAGAQLANFGGFLKASWRADDWMWGRIAGAERIAHLLADGQRLATLRLKRDAAWCAIVQAVTGEQITGASSAERSAFYDEHKVRPAEDMYVELEFLDRDPAAAVSPPPLVETARWIAGELVREVAAEELPKLAGAVVTSYTMDGARAHSKARKFAERILKAHKEETIRAHDTVDKLLASDPIADEAWTDEIGTDLFTKVAVNAAQITTNLVRNPLNRIPVPKKAADRVGVVMSALHLFVTFSLRRTKATAVAVSTLIAFALAALAWAVAAGDTGGPPKTLILVSGVVFGVVALAVVIRGLGRWTAAMLGLVVLSIVASVDGLKFDMPDQGVAAGAALIVWLLVVPGRTSNAYGQWVRTAAVAGGLLGFIATHRYGHPAGFAVAAGSAFALAVGLVIQGIFFGRVMPLLKHVMSSAALSVAGGLIAAWAFDNYEVWHGGLDTLKPQAIVVFGAAAVLAIGLTVLSISSARRPWVGVRDQHADLEP